MAGLGDVDWGEIDMTVSVGGLKLVIAIVVLVVALVLAVMGQMPWLTAGVGGKPTD